MYTATRELPDGARQQAGTLSITSEQRTEDGNIVIRLRRVRPVTAHYECRRMPEQEWYRRGS